MDLSDKQWEVIKDILPEDPVRADRRKVLNGILWILRTGAQREDLPERYGNHKTVHRRFQNWRRQGVFEDLLVSLSFTKLTNTGSDGDISSVGSNRFSALNFLPCRVSEFLERKMKTRCM